MELSENNSPPFGVALFSLLLSLWPQSARPGETGEISGRVPSREVSGREVPMFQIWTSLEAKKEALREKVSQKLEVLCPLQCGEFSLIFFKRQFNPKPGEGLPRRGRTWGFNPNLPLPSHLVAPPFLPLPRINFL